MRRIHRGLDLPISGAPDQTISDAPAVKSVALMGSDYVGMKPTMEVNEGDRVALGQLLFTDKKTPGVKFTAPGAGIVAAINRGAKRVFESIVIDLEGDDAVEFESFRDRDLTTVSREDVTSALVDCGLWTSLRTRPFSRTPSPGSEPHSIFVTAIDTNPLAVDPSVIVRQNELDFRYGMTALSRLTDGKVYYCKPAATIMPCGDLDCVTTEEFDGPHPAGLPGTHIHFLDPVSLTKTVWYINYQDVIAIGRFMTSGKLDVERIVSLAGPVVKRPRLLRTRVGANIASLTDGELMGSDNRIISGSVLSGRAITESLGWLGRYHLQISAVAEGREREFLGWQKPGFDTFSITRAFLSAIRGEDHRFDLTTSTGGSPRAMVPIGNFEKVMPLDILPTQLLRALITGDIEEAQKLGCLELDEEDLALCTFVCPGKSEYGPILRDQLTVIEKEG